MKRFNEENLGRIWIRRPYRPRSANRGEGFPSPLPNFTDRRNPLHPWGVPLLMVFSILALAAAVVFFLFFYLSPANGTDLIQETAPNPPTLKVWITGYSAEEGYDQETRTSNGTVPGWGTVAVDPETIPYGSVLFIPAYAEMCDRYAVALDCGSAVIGYHIDLWTETNAQSYSLTGWHEVKVLRWGWNHWMCEPKEWGLEETK